ncbi:MAG: hypothetical protein JRI23_13610 [Deltaproteobacteria bacterium]|jgi:hypothetical protein|nr:hypothetical protein [Deltaproteobacteria bacterium]MBW2532765.1 hypothetical protein [Deltaproteobacteria bacterium]
MPASATEPTAPNAPAAAASQPTFRVEAASKGIWFGKPPLATHFLDVTLQNLASEPRWIAVAEMFPYEGSTDPRIGEGEVGELQVFELSRKPRLVLVLTVATGGVWAVRLPARGAIELRRLTVDSWWENIPNTAELEVISAREILLAGKPLASCFDVEATSDPGAKAQAPRDSADPRMLPERCTGSDESSRYLPVEFVGEQRSRVRVALSRDLDG